MRTELKRCNSIGNKEGILFFSKLLLEEGNISVDSIKNRCNLNTHIRLNYWISLLFFEYLEIIEINDQSIFLTSKGRHLKRMSLDLYLDEIGLMILKTLINDGILFNQETKIETRGNVVYYEITSFPLRAAIFRNFLFEIGLIQMNDGGLYLVLSDDLEGRILKPIQRIKKLISQEQLLLQLEKMRIQGELAEKWVLNFENNRILESHLRDKIKIISYFDVQAGYDIVSFESDSSTHFDRFIEVKSYKGKPHFYWSKNESEIAKIKGDNYYLYIVDIVKINDSEYEPIIIQNPASKLYNDSSWLIETQSMLITKLT